MNPSSLPQQGRYSDPRIQQMVIDELRRKDITAEKFYFTSDDWMVSYDGPVPAWNSVFGIAPYRKDGQTFYAECGVSQRYDPNTAQWSEPAATVKEGLPLSQEGYDAAPGALTDAGAPGTGDDADPQDSAQTVLAPSMPDLGENRPGAGFEGGSGVSGVSGVSGSDVGSGESHQERAADQPNDGLAGFVTGSADDSADSADQPGASTDDVRATELATHPAPGGQPDGDTGSGGAAVAGAAAAAGAAGGYVAAGSDEPGQQPQDRPVDLSGSADPADSVGQAGGWPESGAQSGAQVPSYEAAGAEEAAREEESTGPGGGSAVYGGDAINQQEPAYGSAGASGGEANVAGYALTVNDDGTAELQVPLGGSVTLRWAGKQ